MARARKKQTGKVDYDKVIWVIDNLTPEQLIAHDKKPYTPEQILEELLQMADSGFRVTIKYDTFSKSYMASATCMEHGHDNSGLALSNRGNDIVDCYSIMLYKFIEIAHRDLRGFADKIPIGVRG